MQTPGRRVEPQIYLLPLERRMDSLERRLVSLSGKFESIDDTVRGFRRVEPQISLLPLERRMDSLERRFISFSNAQQPDEDTSIRGLGRIVLEMEQMQNNMEAMQKEIRRDLREREKYFKEEQKLLKKDLKNTEDFKTAALFDLRKIIGLFGFAVAANELSQGDIGGALQGVGLGIGAFLPEITTGVVSILAAKGLIGGGMMGGGIIAGGGTRLLGGGMAAGGGGMAAGGLGLLGGKGKGLLALAALGTVLLASGALAGGGGGVTRTRQLDSGFDGNDVINRSDTLRFRSQLGRFDGIMNDVDKTSASPSTSEGEITEEGQNIMSQIGDPENNETRSIKVDVPTPIEGKAVGGPVTKNEPYIVGEEGPELFVPDQSGDIIPSPIFEQGDIEQQSTIIPPSDRIIENITENFIENLAWSPPPQKEEKMVMNTDSKDFNILTAISALEAGDDQARADVAQSIYNRVADTGDYGDTVFDVITRDNQYQPAFEDPTSSDFQPTAQIWKDITDKQSAIAAMLSYYEKRGQVKTKEEMLSLFEQTAAALKNKDLQIEARKHIGGRTEFLGGQVSGDDVVDRGGIEDNAFFAEYGSGTQIERGAQPIPEELLIKQVEVEKAPNQWWDFMDVFPNKQASVTTLPRDREGTSNLIAQPIIATIPGKVTTMPPPSTGEEEFGGDRFAEINTRFQGSIDKLDSAYALNSYAALS